MWLCFWVSARICEALKLWCELACNKGIAYLRHSDNPFFQQHPCQSQYLMDSPCTTPTSVLGSTPCSNDESPRVKFLCSFSGSILPRPQDGKLRYVGGETRIVSVPRDITYEELMIRMRELYQGAVVLKYQQPDEDLDALVSVVNDDDVTNMMEEYDKLGSGDGFTRLRIFLFPHSEQDGSSPYVDGDERETERRYVDALNNLNDDPDFRKQQLPESPRMSPVEDVHVAEQFFNTISVESGLHSQRTEMPLPQYNTHHLTIPHVGSAPHQPHRYNEMEAPWSPAYYSPRHPGHHDPRQLGEFPSSPSSARYRMPFTELPEKGLDRMSEEYARQQVNHQPMHEHQPQYSENVVWVPTGARSGDKSGFTGNLFHGPSVLEGNSVCEHCRMTFHRNPPHLEQPHMGNGLSQVITPCAECPQNRDTLMLNADAKMHHGVYPNEHTNDHRSVYNDIQNHERGWILQHQLNARVDEGRLHVSGAGRLTDHYVVDGPAMNFPLGHGNIADSHHVSANYAHHRGGPDLGNEVLHDPALASVPHIRIPPPEERGVRYGNLPHAYGGDNLYPMSHGHVPGHALWINSPTHVSTTCEASSLPQQVNGAVSPVLLRREGSPRLCVGVDSQIPQVESSQKILGFDGTAMPEYSYGRTLKLNQNASCQENNHSSRTQTDMVNFAVPLEPMPLLNSTSTLVHDKLVSSAAPGCSPELKSEGKSIFGGEKGVNQAEKVENSDLQTISAPEPKQIADKNCEETSLRSTNSIYLKPAEECSYVLKPGEVDLSAPEGPKVSVDHLSLLPELIASVKRAALEGPEEVKGRVEGCADLQGASGNDIESAVREK